MRWEREGPAACAVRSPVHGPSRHSANVDGRVCMLWRRVQEGAAAGATRLAETLLTTHLEALHMTLSKDVIPTFMRKIGALIEEPSTSSAGRSPMPQRAATRSTTSRARPPLFRSDPVDDGGDDVGEGEDSEGQDEDEDDDGFLEEDEGAVEEEGGAATQAALLAAVYRLYRLEAKLRAENSPEAAYELSRVLRRAEQVEGVRTLYGQMRAEGLATRDGLLEDMEKWLSKRGVRMQ